MRSTFFAVALLCSSCLSCAQKVGDAVPYNSWAKYPLLNTKETIPVYGDAEVPLEELKKSGNAYQQASVIRFSALCKAQKYSCAPMATPENQGKNIRAVYSVNSAKVGEKTVGAFELVVFMSEKKLIDSALVYLPPRPETGLSVAELRFVDAFVRTFTGQAVNKTLLSKCYWVNKEDMRENCVVQSPTANGRQYNVVVNFLNLDHEVGKPLKPNLEAALRSFSVKILPVTK